MVVWIREFRDYNFDDPLMVKTLEETFLKLAVLKPHKLKQLDLFEGDKNKF